MSELGKVELFDMFEHRLPSTGERLRQAYANPKVHERSMQIMKSSGQERLELEAQLTTYLAAGHTLFPEESIIILQSLQGSNEK